MSRMTSLDDVLFRVETVPAGAVVTTGAETRFIRSTTVRAIVDADRNRVVGMVGEGYRVVSNEQALEWASKCGQAVFPSTTPADWSTLKVDGPSTGSFCRIDVTHRQAVLDFATKTPGLLHDAFGPFIRVTNSFNGQRALRFDIGLLRRMCTNGMIIADTIVSFRFPHSRAALLKPPDFTVNHAKLKSWFDGFDAQVVTLQEYLMTPAVIFDVVCAVLRLRPPSNPEGPEYLRREWDLIQNHLNTLIARYSKEAGENAYAAFNVLTDFATRPKGRGSYAREIHTLQRRVGAWLPDFCARSRLPGFRMKEYLKDLSSASTAKGPGAGRVAARTVAS